MFPSGFLGMSVPFSYLKTNFFFLYADRKPNLRASFPLRNVGEAAKLLGRDWIKPMCPFTNSLLLERPRSMGIPALAARFWVGTGP